MTLKHIGSGRLRGNVSYTAACNSFFQGLAADGAKEALWRVSRECFTDPSSVLYGCQPVAFMHDEIILEVPEERVHDAARRLEELMVEGMQQFIPDVPIEVEALAMRFWSKDARRLLTPDGKLRVWPDTE